MFNQCEHYNMGARGDDFNLCDECNEIIWQRCPDCSYEIQTECYCKKTTTEIVDARIEYWTNKHSTVDLAMRQNILYELNLIKRSIKKSEKNEA